MSFVCIFSEILNNKFTFIEIYILNQFIQNYNLQQKLHEL